MFVLSVANLKSSALSISRNPSGDRVIPIAEVRVRAKAFCESIISLSRLQGVDF